LCGLNWRVETGASRTGGREDWLEVVKDPEDLGGAAGFGTVPEVEEFGDDGTVLGGDNVEDEVEAGAAEVLAFVTLAFDADIAAG
jgi:hypothetical protein